MNEANKISLPLRGNDELAAVLSGASTGDKVILTKVTICIDEVTQELVTGTVEEVEGAQAVDAPADEVDESERENAKKAPVMSVMSSDRERDGSPDISHDSLTA